MKNTRLYLNVPYKEKDEAKVLGARWDPERKEWYTSNTNNYHFFRKWYYNPSADAVLYDYIYILMANRTCFRCKKQTQVIALASNDTTLIYENNIKHYNNDIQLFRCIGYLSEILSSFLKDKFNFYYSYSKFTKSYYYGNHCLNCGALQGDNYLYNEIDSVFFINSIEKVKNITLFKLLLPEAILISYDSVNSDIIMLNAPQANNSLLKKYSKIKDLTI